VRSEAEGDTDWVRRCPAEVGRDDSTTGEDEEVEHRMGLWTAQDEDRLGWWAEGGCQAQKAVQESGSP
jgi:hypothetical protein